MKRQIGTVVIVNADQAYPTKPGKYNCPPEEVGEEMAYVEEGSVFPLYESDGHRWWEMKGNVLDFSSDIERLGDGLFTMSTGPRDTGRTVEFSSVVMNAAEWIDFMENPRCVEGHPEQRLRFTISVAAQTTSLPRYELKDVPGVTIDYAIDGSVQITVPGYAVEDFVLNCVDSDELMFALESKRTQAVSELKEKQAARKRG